MEPISVDALQTIATAKGKVIALKEICDNVSEEYRDALKDGLSELSDAFDALSDDIETLMELGEPVPFMAPLPEIAQAIEGIQNLGHEAGLMVVDYTLYEGVYPLITPVTMQGA
jgi:hypothetical protein